MGLSLKGQRLLLLGKSLDMHMKCAGLSQGRLEHLINIRLGQMVEEKQISYEASLRAGNSQTNIGRICKGTIHPSYNLLKLVVQSLEDWYSSEEFSNLMERQKENPAGAGKPDFEKPEFTRQDADDLFHLAGYATPNDIDLAVQRATEREWPKDSPIVKEMEARQDAMKKRMGNGHIHLIGAFVPLPLLAPHLLRPLFSAVAGLLTLLVLHHTGCSHLIGHFMR